MSRVKEALEELLAGCSLTEEKAALVMEEIMTGKATPAQIAGFLMALRMKGEVTEEIVGCAKVMRKKAFSIPSNKEYLVDTCGTGGDGASTFNVSTTTALVLAGAGISVAKHGNRSVSSQCGSADVLEELGVNIDLSPKLVGEAIDKVGIGFLFAPVLHGAMKYALGPRRELGVRTIFNVLGPLTNPAGAKGQVLGVYKGELTRTLAEVLQRLGTQKAYVVHGAGGLDEVSLAGETKVVFLNNGEIEEMRLTPEDFGLSYHSIQSIKGARAETNAQILRSVLEGKKGAYRDIVLANSALGMIVGLKTQDLREAVEMAKDSIDSGKALKVLNNLIEFSVTAGSEAV